MISLSDVSVTFPDGTLGLTEVSLDVEPGEFVCLVGPSGSGKTTLLRTIAGFVTPSSGTVSIGGAPMDGVPPERRGLGMVFQQHAVWPHMSVFENVAYPLRRARKFSAPAVTEALALVGLSGFDKRSPASLSGGQRQRVALARAIVSSPRVLLLDEALSALDEPLRDSLRRDILSLVRRQGLTAVHVTHDRSEALALADRVVVLADGAIQQIGTSSNILNSPVSAFVAAFMGDATVLPTGEAVLPADVVVDEDGTRRGTVRSALFDRTGFSLTIESDGLEFRAMSPTQVAIGDEVRFEFRRVLSF
ncbi:ABC transporter ATP-binding protein [Corynebacterium epidermidicanis]|uniref:ABC-type quaternary amine transporter n=1 Tax=Corynebacterium epidermidicanis TaxID=1050174 RepID=A0A0G3GW21_9CORY|nr:ABC transporter ATP-binding protein [Corynebacterium epidermidicanis]AKK03703.1 ABC-type spermidine/putrescine transport system, ATPase component [Corynebacterium epidermidicanis]